VTARTILAICLAAALALSACGGSSSSTSSTKSTSAAPTTPTTGGGRTGGGGSGGASDEQQIRSTVAKLLTSEDPEQVCQQLVTPNYVKQSFGDLKGCERATVPGSAARSVKVSKPEVLPGGATVKAVPKGGPSSGETLTVQMAMVSGGAWKVDRVRSNAPVGP
jgi:hypothetical protein